MPSRSLNRQVSLPRIDKRAAQGQVANCAGRLDDHKFQSIKVMHQDIQMVTSNYPSIHTPLRRLISYCCHLMGIC